MLSKIGKYKVIAEPFHCDINKELFVGTLGNQLLNASDLHSSERGFGIDYLQKINRTWVLSRLVIEITQMPKIYEEFSIETWVESAMRFFTNRNFYIEGKDGSPVGYGRSIWAMIDTNSRQPANILDVNGGKLASWIEVEKENPIDKPARIIISKNAELSGEYKASYSDIDINGHVNSIKYIEHILDLISIDQYKQKFLKKLNIAYITESYVGDILRFYKESNNADNEYYFSIRKVTVDGEVECVRLQIKFENR